MTGSTFPSAPWRLLVALLTASALVLLGTVFPGGPAAAATDPPAPDLEFRIEDEDITEASGMARSQRHPDTWWVTNDSGDRARVFAIDAQGRTTGVLEYDARVRDVEALAVAPGPDGTGALYIADIGDNLRRRDVRTVYRVAESALSAGQPTTADPFPLEFEDGRHDAEALAVHPTSGRFVVVSKDSAGAIYATDGTPAVGVTTVLRRLATGPVLATDATFNAEGTVLYVRTMVGVEAFTWPSLESLGGVPAPVVGPDGSPLIGESVALGPEPGTLFIGSEGERSPVYRITAPDAPGATPTPSPTLTVTPGEPAPSLGATLRPVLLAGAAAVGVGTLLLLVSRRRGRRH